MGRDHEVIYGGVRTDAWVVREAWDDYRQGVKRCGIPTGLLPLAVLDMPLSAGTDTLLLPVTIVQAVAFEPPPPPPENDSGEVQKLIIHRRVSNDE